jgi:hypothetical protein
MIKEFKKSEIKNLLKEKNLLEFNRDIQSRHVEKMRKSVLSCGVLRLPVIGDVSAFDSRNLVIVDGQHLCKAFTSMPKNSDIGNISVIVKKYDNKKQVIEDISKLNNTQKTWNDENYLDAWFKYGKDNVDYFSNYAYLHNMYNNVYDGLPCGFLIDLYANSKEGFREGELEFRNREFSDKLASLCFSLQTNHKKASFALHGLRLWAFNRLSEKKELNWKKLTSRLNTAIKNDQDKNFQGREDFRVFIQEVYTRL